jgi:hypothetical protein
MSTSATAPEARVGPVQVFISFLAPPVLWSLHLVVSYFLVALDCTTSWNGGGTAIAIVTALFAAATLGSGVLAWRSWRRMREEMMPGELMDPVRIRGFLVFSGVVMAPPFALMVVLAGMSPLFAPMCG